MAASVPAQDQQQPCRPPNGLSKASWSPPGRPPLFKRPEPESAGLRCHAGKGHSYFRDATGSAIISLAAFLSDTKFFIHGGFCKSRVIRKKNEFFNYSPHPSVPFPLKGAREVVAPQSFPAPFGGRMSKGQEGGCVKQSRLLQKPL